MPNTQLRSYRCHYMPKTPGGYAQWNAEGVYPFVQIKARNAIAALESARAVTGSPVINAQRMEGGAETVILSLPQGSGKSLQAPQLAYVFGCTSVVDEWHPGQPITPGALHLTNVGLQGGAA
jgi:hypothetical protein